MVVLQCLVTDEEDYISIASQHSPVTFIAIVHLLQCFPHSTPLSLLFIYHTFVFYSHFLLFVLFAIVRSRHISQSPSSRQPKSPPNRAPKSSYISVISLIMVSNFLSFMRGTSLILPVLLTLQTQVVNGDTFNFHVSVPIPADLTQNDIISALHDHNNVLTLQAFTTGHTLDNSTDPDTLNDPYWNPINTSPITTYTVTECVPIIPDIGNLGKKCLTFPSSFQDTEQGIKTRADAPAGIIVRAEFQVASASDAGSDSEVTKRADGAWALVENVELTENALLMPFVKTKMEDAHKDICQKLVNMVQSSKNGTASQRRSNGRMVKRGALGTGASRMLI